MNQRRAESTVKENKPRPSIWRHIGAEHYAALVPAENRGAFPFENDFHERRGPQRLQQQLHCDPYGVLCAPKAERAGVFLPLPGAPNFTLMLYEREHSRKRV